MGKGDIKAMRRVLLVYLAYVALQALTSLDPAIRSSWLVYGAFGVVALTGRWTALVAFEAALWLRIMAVPVFYFYWGSAIDVTAPALACVAFAYALWTLRERRRATFLLPLAVPMIAIAVIRLEVMPLFFPKAVLAARLEGVLNIEPRPMPPGQVRYHCAGYSIGVPLGMTSGYLGGEKADTFSFKVRPPGESMKQIAMVFPQRTSFVGDPDVQAMAAQLLGVASELEYARYVLAAHDGYMFMIEKLAWLGMKPPERIEELHVGGVYGFLLSVERVNWYRARLYFDRAGEEHQVDVWFYGEDTDGKTNPFPLRKARVLEALASLRVEPEERRLPTLEDCRSLATSGANHQQNIFLNSLLSIDASNYEALYLLGMNQQRLGLEKKAFQIRRRLLYYKDVGTLAPALFTGWQNRYGQLGPFPGVIP